MGLVAPLAAIASIELELRALISHETDILIFVICFAAAIIGQIFHWRDNFSKSAQANKHRIHKQE